MTVCSGSLEHVELALLEGSELSPAVQAHLTSCSSCAAQAETLKGIVAALQASPAPTAPADLAARLVPLVLAEAQKGRRQSVFARAMRPVAAFATAFGVVVASIAAAGSALVVSAALTAGNRNPAPESTAPATEAPVTTEAPATQAPATEAPATEVPATAAPATEAPSESSEPVATPTPEPTDVPRRTPDPVSPEPSEGESAAPAESTSP
jgi:anti-sigma factor RsiW